MTEEAKSTHKRQFWLRPDQIELVVACLRFTQHQLDTDQAGGAHKYVSGPFTYKRIEELISIFGESL